MPDRTAYPNLAHCHRCERPISHTPRGEEPVLCGQCTHEIRQEAGRVAIGAYMTAARHEEGGSDVA